MIITKNFKQFIRNRCRKFYILGGLQEYERAKRLIIEDGFTKEEVEEALQVIADWCGV